MGFGLCSFGFLFLILDAVGLDFAGYALMGLGFYRVGQELSAYKGYKLAGYAAFGAAVPALLNLYDFLTAFGLPALPQVLVGVKGASLAALGAFLCFAYCGSTARIATEGGARTFALRARLTAYISALYYAMYGVLGFTGATGTVVSVLFVGKYIVPVLNAWLLFTCFTTITTKAREKVEEKLIKQELQILERKRALKKAKDEEDQK